MNNIQKINLIAQLAQESEVSDPIEWGYLNIDEKTAYKMMAAHVVDEFDNKSDHELVMLSTITKLLVENFVLNIKLNEQIQRKPI